MAKHNKQNKKQSKEAIAFRAIEKLREGLIRSLTNCSTWERLEILLNKYEADVQKGLFRVNLGNFTSKYRLQIQGMDEEIKELIEEKRALYAPKPVLSEESEASDMNEELSVEDEVEEAVKDNFADNENVIEHLIEDLLSDVAFHKIEHINGPVMICPPLDKKVDPKRVLDLAAVKQHLDALSDKRAEFDGKIVRLLRDYTEESKQVEEYRKARNAINHIHTQIEVLYNKYVCGEIELEAFKNAAKPLLNNENEHVQTLQSHRGVKQILVNLLAFVLTLGVGYGVAALATGRFMLFKPHTNSSKTAEDLLQSIDHAQASPAA